MIVIKAPSTDEWLMDLFAYQRYCHGEESSNAWLMRALRIALNEELSEEQRECVIEYYGNNRKMREIAELRRCDVSTVSRNLSRARSRLFRVLKYTSMRLLKEGR